MPSAAFHDAGTDLRGCRRARLARGLRLHRVRGGDAAAEKRRPADDADRSAGMTGLPGSKGDVNVVAGGAMGSGLPRFGRVHESGPASVVQGTA